MFTGIIEEIGTLRQMQQGEKSIVLTIKGEKIVEDTNIGDSISLNGVCLTVADLLSDGFVADVMPETLERSNLGNLAVGSRLNLERALRLSDRLGGHIVNGHIDGTGRIQDIKKDDNAVWLTVTAEPHVLNYIIEKGSVAIDGISLTVATVDNRSFQVSIIPHTGEQTTLLEKRIGDTLNIECDTVGKYIEKLMGHAEDENRHGSRLNKKKLEENSFSK